MLVAYSEVSVWAWYKFTKTITFITVWKLTDFGCKVSSIVNTEIGHYLIGVKHLGLSVLPDNIKVISDCRKLHLHAVSHFWSQITFVAALQT